MDFTPSEIVVLFPERFAGAIGIFSRTMHLADGRQVASAALGRAASLAAVLANREAGVVRLEVGEHRALLGLVRSERVVAIPGNGTLAWPDGTLEAAVAERVCGESREIDSLFRDIIESDRTDPWAWLVSRVEAGLAARGLLTAERSRRLLIFSGVRLSVPVSTRVAADAIGPAPAEALLRRSEADESSLWKALDRAIRSAAAMRTASID